MFIGCYINEMIELEMKTHMKAGEWLNLASIERGPWWIVCLLVTMTTTLVKEAANSSTLSPTSTLLGETWSFKYSDLIWAWACGGLPSLAYSGSVDAMAAPTNNYFYCRIYEWLLGGWCENYTSTITTYMYIYYVISIKAKRSKNIK